MHIFTVILENIVKLLTSWPFDLSLLIILFNKQFKSFFKDVNHLVLNKDGLAFKKVTEEAKETLNDLKELSFTIFVPLLELITTSGRMDSLFSIEERLKCRDAIKLFLSKNNTEDISINEKIKGLNNSILFDILILTVDKLNGTDNIKIYEEVYKLINVNIGKNNFFECNPNIEEIRKTIENENLLTDEIEYILQEAKYFIQNNTFKDFPKVKQILYNIQKYK